MKNKLSNFVITGAVLITVILCFNACLVASNKMIQDNGKEIPSDLGNPKTTILVIEHNRKSYDNSLEKNWNKHYTGDFIIISNDDVSKAKYMDTKKYRYVFDYSNIASSSSGRSTLEYRFYLLDRQDGHKYITRLSELLWSEFMIAYIKKMNEIRAKNGDN